MEVPRSPAVFLFLRLLASAALLSLMFILHANAAINEQIPFYGTLTDTAGTELSGTYDMVFRFYDAPTGGTLLDTSTHTAANGNAVTVSNGEFNVLLGSGTGNTLDGLDFNTDTIYIGLSIEGDSEMTPRERLGSAPYAFNSDTVDGYDATQLLRYNATGSITTTSADTLFTITQSGAGDIFNIYDGGSEVVTVLDGGNVGIGTSTPNAALAIAGDLQLTGSLIDSNYSAGTSGYVLQSNGAGTQWVATSSLGITGGGSSLFTDGGATTYLTATSDALAIGTTTAPSGTKFSVYGGGLTVSEDVPRFLSSTTAAVATSSSSICTEELQVHAGYAYIADSDCFDTNLHIYDIRYPKQTTHVGSVYNSEGGITDFVIIGEYLYAVSDGDDAGELWTYDISDPSNPILVDKYFDPTLDFFAPYGIAASGEYLFVVGSRGGSNELLHTFSLVDPADPEYINGYASPSATYDYRNIEIRGDYGFITASDASNNWIEVMHLGDPHNPSFTASTTVTDDISATRGYVYANDFVYVLSPVDDSMMIVDVHDPTNPEQVGYLQDAADLNSAISIAVSDSYAYVTSEASSLMAIIDISSSTNPKITATTSYANFIADKGLSGLYISGNNLFSSTDANTSPYDVDLVAFQVAGVNAPTGKIGSLLSDRFDTDIAHISQLLTVDGAFNVTHNALISGSLSVLGEASSSNAALTVDGEIVLSSTTPATTTNALYNQSGTLYFNGSAVTASTFTALTDTPASLTANAVLFASSSGSALLQSTNFVFDGTNLGIGTSSPTRTLTVDGDLQLTGNLYDSQNDAGSDGQVLKIVGGLPTWSTDVSGGGGAGLWASSSNNLLIYPADQNDIVLIGGTATSSTSTIFEVVGSSLLDDVTLGGLLTVEGTGTSTFLDNVHIQGDLRVGTSSVLITGSGLRTISGDLTLEAGSGGSIRFGSESATTTLYSDSNSGFVGIGTTTPSSKLTVAGDANSALIALADETNNRESNIIAGDGSPEGSVNAPVGSLYIDNGGGALYIKETGSANTGWVELGSGSGGGGGGSGTTTHMAEMSRNAAQSIPNASGTVVAFDTEVFDVGGLADPSTNTFTIQRDGKYLVNAYAWMGSIGTNESLYVEIWLNGARRSYGRKVSHANTINWEIGVTQVMDLSAGDELQMRIWQNSGGSVNTETDVDERPRMQIVELASSEGGGSSLFTDSGTTTYLTSLSDTLAIGTTSSSYKASVWGDLFVGTSTVPNLLIRTGTGNVGIGTSTPDQALDVDGTIQASNLFGGAVNLTTDANGNIIRDPSDERLKTNITAIDNALETVLDLRGVRYQWKDAARFGSSTEIGFIAQEVDLILPEVVRKGGEYWSLNTRNMLAVVVEAIKELWQTVSGNQERITELEKRIEVLEHKHGIGNEEDETENAERSPSLESSIDDDPETETEQGTPAVGDQHGASTTASSSGGSATSTDETDTAADDDTLNATSSNESANGSSTTETTTTKPEIQEMTTPTPEPSDGTTSSTDPSDTDTDEAAGGHVSEPEPLNEEVDEHATGT